MIALSHKTNTTHTVHVSTPEQADALFNLAKPGDTLHSVFPSANADEVMSQIGSQLKQGNYKTL